MRRAALALAGLAAAFAVLTWLVLEGGDVAVLTTQRAEGGVRETHVWWAEADGVIWVEAATPERAWLAEALARGEVTLARDGRRERMRVERAPGADPHARVRALLRAKYGLRDVFVGWLQDTSRSVAVLLRPSESATGRRE